MSAGEIDGWRKLAALTPARIALGRAGAGLPTREVLKFALAHAQARDAVHAPFDAAAMASALEALTFPGDGDIGSPSTSATDPGPSATGPVGDAMGSARLTAVTVTSDAAERSLYLRRPDLGRRLSDESARTLDALSGEAADLAIVVGDGLSATGVQANAVPLVAALLPHLRRLSLSLAPVVVATGARVALGDDIAARLTARMVLVLIGERPGLSSPDSLGAYLTFEPGPGRTDAERNCVSNIRAGGLTPARAAFQIAWLIEAAFRLGLTGVKLKDRSGEALESGERDVLGAQ